MMNARYRLRLKMRTTNVEQLYQAINPTLWGIDDHAASVHDACRTPNRFPPSPTRRPSRLLTTMQIQRTGDMTTVATPSRMSGPKHNANDEGYRTRKSNSKSFPTVRIAQSTIGEPLYRMNRFNPARVDRCCKRYL